MPGVAHRKLLSPKDLAAAIGASESSMKRWTDQGKIEVTRTEGGHRRIAVSDAIRFVREQGYPLLKPEILGLPTSLGPEISLRSPADRLSDGIFADLLRTGHDVGARNHILARFLEGESIAQLADGPIRNAMNALGEMWREGPEGIFVEHRATEICSQLLRDLRSLVLPQQPVARALGGAIGGDPYKLAPLAVAATLAECGLNAVNLGADTPIEVLEVASLGDVVEERPQLVWITASSVTTPDESSQAIRKFGERCDDAGVLLLVGGRESHRLDLAGARGIVSHDSLQRMAREVTERFTPGTD